MPLSRYGVPGAGVDGRWQVWAGVGCGVLVVLVVVVCVGVYALLHGSPPIPEDVKAALEASGSAPGIAGPSASRPSGAAGSAPSQPAPPSASGSGGAPQGGAAVPPVQVQVGRIERAIRSGYVGPVRLVITQEELNRQLASSAGGSAHDIKIVITDGRIAATGKIGTSGRSVQVYAEAEPRVENNKPRLVLVRGYVGRFPIPRDKLSKLQAQLDRQIASKLGQAGPVQVTSITAADGRLIIDGTITGRSK